MNVTTVLIISIVYNVNGFGGKCYLTEHLVQIVYNFNLGVSVVVDGLLPLQNLLHSLA